MANDRNDEPTELQMLETYADAGYPPAVFELARRRAAGEKVQEAGLVEALVAGGYL